MALGFNYKIDPVTGDYEMVNGAFVLDQTLQTPTLLALKEELGRWWGNVDFGSALAETMRGAPPADPIAALRQATIDALRLLQRLGRVASYTVVVTGPPYEITINAVDGGTGSTIVLGVPSG